MSRRAIMRIELNENAKKQLEVLSERHGMTQIALMSRLVEYFASQSSSVQSAMIGRYPAAMRSTVAKLLIKQMVN